MVHSFFFSLALSVFYCLRHGLGYTTRVLFSPLTPTCSTMLGNGGTKTAAVGR